MRDQHLDPEYLESQLRLKPFILQAMQNFSLLFQQVESHLRQRGDYYRLNSGEFYYGLTHIDFSGKSVLGFWAEFTLHVYGN